MTFAEAVDQVAHHSQNGHGRRLSVADIAERIGRTENYLRKATSQYDDAHPLRGDLIVPLTMATGNKTILRYLSEATGGVYIELPKVDEANVDVVLQAGKTAQEFGDVLAEAGHALADGRVTRDEAEAFRKQATEAVTEIMQFVALMDRKAGIAVPVLATRQGAA